MPLALISVSANSSLRLAIGFYSQNSIRKILFDPGRGAWEKTEIDHPSRDAPRLWRRHGEIFSRLLFFRDRRNFYPCHWLRRRRRRGERKGESCGRISRRVRGRRGRPKRQRSAGVKRMAVGREIKETIGFTTTTEAKASPCRNHAASSLSLSLYPTTFLASFFLFFTLFLRRLSAFPISAVRKLSSYERGKGNYLSLIRT